MTLCGKISLVLNLNLKEFEMNVCWIVDFDLDLDLFSDLQLFFQEIYLLSYYL